MAITEQSVQNLYFGRPFADCRVSMVDKCGDYINPYTGAYNNHRLY